MTNDIQDLAHHFVKNHLRLSLTPSEWHKVVQDEVITDRTERRVIVVVGAGASKDIGIPLADEARDELKNQAAISAEGLKAELDRLSQTYNLEREAFETYLRALSTSVFEAQKLRDTLQKIYNKKFLPVLGYEILAHMLKHRFIDAIINFNFDELLDQSISDELDKSEYHHILSDGDCPDESQLKEMDPELPFYVKPHGTASHKSTLRFTREDYYGVPLDIQRILKYLLTEKQIILIVIGFSMKSLEFMRILEDVKFGSQIFHINLESPPVPPKIQEIFNKPYLLQVDSEARSFSVVLTEVWDNIYNSFKKGYHPRGIDRHVLVSKIFHTKKIKDQNLENYLRGRTVIELCLSIAKGKGLVTVSRLTEDRSGKYFGFYKKINPDANFYEMSRRIGLRDVGYSREAMSLGADENTKDEKSQSKIVHSDDFKKLVDQLFNRVQDNLDPDIRDQMLKPDFVNTLETLYRNQEVELRYPPSNPDTRIFKFPKPIPTYTTFRFYTEKILKQNWKYLLVIAETGQWLNDSNIVDIIKNKNAKNENRKIFLIVADNSRTSDLTSTYGDKIIGIKELPWWEHNRHMTIVVNESRIAFSSIYFARRLRTASVVPVLLDNIDDSLIALEAFHAYLLKASTPKPVSWINSSDAKNFNNLFDIIDNNVHF